MLKICGISKTYRAKSGVTVKALDNISLTFPDHGMVFLLGKSGSGKSTLLNVVGGLDKFDEGELIIKGKTSKAFRASDFDAYRNTFIGFIFQEYNILEEFSVGANIALALQLQGKKATDEDINRILEQVDLLDFAHRKPNELSGGQKQRIAIARALIKDPEIIMADEPTGALDSNTGKQVLETLKKLSKTKLVLVVSHDREFAEQYGDRIIELADGQIISDITQSVAESTGESAGVAAQGGISVLSDNLIHIRRGYTLTAEDLEMINNYLRDNDQDILLSKDERINEGVCEATGVRGQLSVQMQRKPTGEVEVKEYKAEDTKFIKSRLPIKNAVKIGLGSVKHKPIRLIFTILLSLVAFTLFGLADTMASYEKNIAAVDSLYDSDLSALAVELRLRRNVKYTFDDGTESENTDYYTSDLMNDEDITSLQELLGVDLVPVYNGQGNGNSGAFNFWNCLIETNNLNNRNENTMFPNQSAYGIIEADETLLNKLGFSLVGTMPKTNGEIAITRYLYQMCKLAGIRLADGTTIDAASLTDAINSANSIIGKSIVVSEPGGQTHTFKVVGIVDTGFDFDSTRYESFHWNYINSRDKNDYAIRNQLQTELQYGYHALLFAHPSLLNTLTNTTISEDKSVGIRWEQGYVNVNMKNTFGESLYSIDPAYFVGNSELSNFDIAWINETKTVLGTNEAVLPISIISNMTGSVLKGDFFDKTKTYVREEPGFERSLSLYSYFKVAGEYDVGAVDREDIIAYYNKTYNESLTITDYETIIKDALNSSTGTDFTYSDWLTIFNWAFVQDALDFERLLGYSIPTLAAFQYAYNHDEAVLEMLGNPDNAFCLWATNVLSSGVNELTTDKAKRCNAFTQYVVEQENMGSNSGLYDRTVLIDLRRKATESYFSNNSELAQYTFVVSEYDHYTGMQTEANMAVVGFYFPKTRDETTYLLSETYYNVILQKNEEFAKQQGYEETIAEHESGKYAFALFSVPAEDRTAVTKMVEKHYSESEGIEYRIQNNVIETLDSYSDMIETLGNVFLYVGIGFAAFAALMMLNFISASVTYKKREIGILRAVGARSSDVFSIFFSEAFFIALINFILAVIGTVTTVLLINHALRSELGFQLTLLHFGIRQVALIFGVSVLVAFLGSFLPVKGIASKNPVDAMKDR